MRALSVFEFLQREGKIGRLTIPNRVVMPAMGVNLASRGKAFVFDPS